MIQKITYAALAIGLSAAVTAQEPKKAAEAEAAPELPKLSAAEVKEGSSYALGYRAGAEFGQQFGRFGLQVDDISTESFIKGFLKSFQNQEPDLSEEKLQAAMQGLGDMLQEREKMLSETNLKKGEEFLAENAKRKGVTTTDSGLQYEVIEKGGEEKYKAPKEGEPQKQFQVRYKGTLIDGSEFDASPGEETVPMNLQVVPGFAEALTSMPVGSKWKLFLPSELAYGEQRRSADIAPNSVLIFELELVKIEDAPAPQQQFPFPMPGGMPPGGGR